MKKLLAALAFHALSSTSFAQVEDWRTGIEADHLIVGNTSAFWKGNCSAFPSATTQIKEAYFSGPATTTWLSRIPCNTTNEIRGGFASSTYTPSEFFYISGIGEVRGSRRPVITTTPDPTRIHSDSLMASTGQAVFWTDEEGEFRDGGRLFRILLTGGSRETIADYNAFPRAAFTKLMPITQDRIIALRTDGVLMNYSRIVLAGSPIWSTSTIASNVTIATQRNDTLYWLTVSGNTGTFRRASITNTASQTTLGTQTIAALQSVSGLTHADGRLWFSITTFTSPTRTSELRRLNATTPGPTETVASLPYEIKQLDANDRYVCWIKNRTTISRIPVGVAALTRNLAIARPSDVANTSPFLEIIQSVQNQRNENPLVAEKITHVRAYGRILASSSGETSLMPSPPIVLFGTRSGIPLPGSPLIPIPLPARPPLTTDQGARTSQTSGYWFRLPASWVTEGTISLIAEVNPSRSHTETNYLDNRSPAQSATFTQKAPIGLKFIPTVTQFGTIGRYEPSFQEFFDQLESLLPTSDLRFQFTNDRLDEEHGIFGLGDHSPFEFRPGDDDYSKVLWGLGWKKVFGSGSQLAEPGGYDHYVAMLPAASNQGVSYSGVAWPGDEVSITVSQSLFFVNPLRSPLGARLDATTQAQEIGHNYGLRHVDCGNPSDINILHPYPYPNDVLSTPAAGYQGFNPLNNRLIAWGEATDFMTYCDPKWTSDHAWKRLFSRISSGFGPRSPRGQAATAHLLGGFIDIAAETTEIFPAMCMNAAETTRATNSLPPTDGRYELQAWSDNTLVRTIPVRAANPPADEGAESDTLAWLAMPSDLSGINRLELTDTKSGKALGEILGGGNAPTVTVLTPKDGSVITDPTFDITWDSEDDGPKNSLFHMVRFSNNNGSTWHLLTNNDSGKEYTVSTADVPGGTKCLVEVIASDGILSTSGRSGNFSIPNKAPSITFYFENSRSKICAPLATATVDCGESLILHAEAFDLEDGYVSDSLITWSITGPATRTGTGRTWQPNPLRPGTYNVAATVTDLDGAITTAGSTLIVRPAYIEEALTTPIVDGYPIENAYTIDRIPKQLRYATGEVAEIRLIHRSGKLVLAASGLLSGTFGDSRFAFGLDLDNNGGAPNAADLLITVNQNGSVLTYQGNGGGWIPTEGETEILGALSGDTRWSVELSISDARLNSWNGRPVRAFLAHLDRNAIFDTTPWSDGTLFNFNNAASMILGPDPEDPTDSDNDGMPDSWERTHFGSITNTGLLTDSDGDGQSDALEFITGTDPRNPSKTFKMTPGATPGTLSWNSAPGRSYSIWRSRDLIDWQAIANGIPDAGSFTTWTDPAPLAGSAYYRTEAHYCR